MEKTTIYKQPISEILFEEELTIAALMDFKMFRTKLEENPFNSLERPFAFLPHGDFQCQKFAFGCLKCTKSFFDIH